MWHLQLDQKIIPFLWLFQLSFYHCLIVSCNEILSALCQLARSYSCKYLHLRAEEKKNIQTWHSKSNLGCLLTQIVQSEHFLVQSLSLWLLFLHFYCTTLTSTKNNTQQNWCIFFYIFSAHILRTYADHHSFKHASLSPFTLFQPIGLQLCIFNIAPGQWLGLVDPHRG